MAGREPLVNQPVGHRILGAEDVIAVGVTADPLHGLAGVMSQDLFDAVAEEPNLPSLVLDVDGLPLGTAMGLMDEDLRVGKGKTRVDVEGTSPRADCSMTVGTR